MTLATTTTAPLLEARGASKRYHEGSSREIRALESVSLSVPRGAFAALVGPSGGGKTTLLALLGALDRPTAGHVMFDSQDLQEASESERARIRRRIGFVFQSSPMIRGLPAWENVTYPLIPLGVAGAARREKARSLLARVGLPHMLDKKPEELSGGELQRVGVARALVNDPQAILADEPTSNLDRVSGDAVAGLLREIHAGGTTVLIATHDPRLIETADSVYVVEAGRLHPAPGR